ncbi:MAG: hypothetical protein ACLT5H_09805 [Collinsella stercoris]|uniref:hypothetical protein n=1 Tax=Collinsella stercoris TaxID=147206 RepID=UPI003993AAAE
MHFEDAPTVDVLQRLVDAGNTVLVIEHNLDVIKGPMIIDLGPRAVRRAHRGGPARRRWLCKKSSHRQVSRPA